MTRHRYRTRLLGSGSLLALAGLLVTLGTAPSFADAPSATINDADGALTATGYVTLINGTTNGSSATATNSTAISAALTGENGGLSITGTPANATPNTGSVTANTIGAYATGNTATSTVDLAAIENNGATNGIASLTGSANAPSETPAIATTINSSVSTSTLSNEQTDVATGSTLTLANNLITAQTTGNNAGSAVSGQVPSTYAGSGNAASIVLPTSGAPDLTASGDVVIGTSQQNDSISAAYGSGAALANNTIAQTINSSTGATAETLALSSTETGNTLSAQFTGNAANNSVSATAGGAPTLTGSIAVANQQNNVTSLTGGTGESPSASNTGSTVSNSVASGSTANNPITLSDGTVTQANNTISSSATGNSATGTTAGTYGNLIALASGLSLSTSDNQSNVIVSADGSQSIGGGLALANSQANNGTPVSSLTTGGQVSTTVQNAVGSTIGLSGNAITATTAGNNASNAILAPSDSSTTTALIAGSLALGNNQNNLGSPLSATVNGNSVAATVGTDGTAAPSDAATVTGSAVSVADTRLAASGYGNEATNTLSATADTVTGTAGSPETLASFESGSVAAALSVNSSQYSAGSPVTAANTGNAITLTANTATGDGTSLADNFSIFGATGAATLDTVAVSNMASNALSVSATTASSSAGLLNQQTDLSGATATLTNPSVALAVNTAGGAEAAAVTGSTLTVGTSLDGTAGVGNTLRAIAYGNQGSNTLSASATTLTNTADAEAAGVTDVSGYPNVNAAYGLTNSQVENTAVNATASATSAPVSITVGDGGVSNTTVANAGNALVAAAYGNQTSNNANVNATTMPQLVTDTVNVFAPAATVANAQSLNGTVTAQMTGPAAGSLFTTTVGIGGASNNSTLGVNSNTAETLAEGNQAAANNLSISGNNIADAASTTAPLAGLSSGESTGGTSEVAFTAQNLQSVSGAVTATQTGSGALLALGGAVDGSAGQVNGNQFLATAYSNTANNAVTLGTTSVPITTLAASAGTQNVQSAFGTTTATLGAAGTAGAAGLPADNYTGTLNFALDNDGGTSTWNGTSLTVPTGSSLSLNVSSLDSRQLAAVEAILGSNVAGGVLTVEPGTYSGGLGDIGFSATTVTGGAVTAASFTGIAVAATEGTPGTPATPAVQLTVAGPITNATLGVNNNVANATAVANNATNLTSVNATTLSSSIGLGTGNPSAHAAVSADGTTAIALADYGASNVQSLTGNITATASGEVSLSDSATLPVISGSALSVSNNTQQAAAEGNLATTTLTVAATNSNATGALVNDQSGFGNVTANSGNPTGEATLGQIIQAPGALSTSSLAMSGNTNAALAVMNDTTNTVTASGTNLLTANATPTNATVAITTTGTTPGTSATADYTLTNVQAATAGSVGATATSQVLNNDSTNAATNGLSASSVALNGNATSANAYANRANNALNLSGTNLSATGAVTSSQTNDVAVNANATSTVSFALNGGPTTPAASNSSISVGSNTLQAQAVGNQATNALNATPSANYGAQAVGGSSGSSSPTASASYALLNDQSNNGPVSATGNGGSTFSVALNGGTGNTASPVSGSAVTVQGNSLNVGAFGNSATNSVTLVALNTGNATSALNSVQNNTGNVTALATNANFGVSVGGPGAAGSTLSVGNNSVTAHAVGNAVSNAVVVAR